MTVLPLLLVVFVTKPGFHMIATIAAIAEKKLSDRDDHVETSDRSDYRKPGLSKSVPRGKYCTMT